MASMFMPDGDGLGGLLGDLIGTNPKIQVMSESFDPGAGDPIAVYRLDDDSLAGMCVVSLPQAARIGALIAMLPVGAAEDAEKTGALSDSLADNFTEVMNICAQLFSSGGAEHVRLEAVFTERSSLPKEAEKLLGASAERADFSISICDETAGSLSVLTT
ncbi:MAG: hypothetical protein CL908_14735 [Deltaproteobacteria bacterium]|jgi:hypothetical protein|nr:hypothetical protein [Deltaproteobacteria bacterium]